MLRHCIHYYIQIISEQKNIDIRGIFFNVDIRYFSISQQPSGLYSNACGGGEGLESIKLLTSFIQQMHKMKPRNV